MKDKYLGIMALLIICSLAIGFRLDWAKELVMVCVPIIAAVIRD